ncbi:MAG: hypothetical protein ACRETN_12105 [Nevskiales bacterium]
MGVVFFAYASELSARISVEVSSQYSAIEYANTTTLKPREAITSGLPSVDTADRYAAVVGMVGGLLRVVAVDNRPRNSNLGNSVLMDTVLTKGGIVALPRPPTDEGISVGFQNLGPQPAAVSVTVFRFGDRPEWLVSGYRKIVEQPIRALEDSYLLPDINVKVQPCGFANALSTPDVIICTEVLTTPTRGDQWHLLIHAFVMHELAHSLLYLWGLPGHDNEDIADEFMVAVLSILEPEAIDAFVSWLEARDSVSEAIAQLIAGDRHTPSIQRARNIRSAVSRIHEVRARWSRQLSPHKRTSAATSPAGSTTSPGNTQSPPARHGSDLSNRTHPPNNVWTNQADGSRWEIDIRGKSLYSKLLHAEDSTILCRVDRKAASRWEGHCQRTLDVMCAGKQKSCTVPLLEIVSNVSSDRIDGFSEDFDSASWDCRICQAGPGEMIPFTLTRQ